MTTSQLIDRADELYSWFPWYSNLSDNISDFCGVDIYSAYSILRNLTMISDKTTVKTDSDFIYLASADRNLKLTRKELLDFSDFQ